VEKQVDPRKGLGRVADELAFKSIFEANGGLVDIALPIMSNLIGIIRESHFLLVLTDNCGYILETMGDELVNQRACSLKFQRGALWSCDEVGTNAIGLCLELDDLVQMSGAEHFCLSHHGWVCSAAPIHGQNGEIIGCIDLSGDSSCTHSHSLGIVKAIASNIESMIAESQSMDMMYAALDCVSDAVVLLDARYRCTWSNGFAASLLRVSPDEMNQRDFREVIQGIQWVDGDGAPQKNFPDDAECKLCTDKGVFDCTASVKPLVFDQKINGYSITFNHIKKLFDIVNAINGNRAAMTFSGIISEDRRMLHVIQTAKSYAQYDGCIMITGERGLGKEIFAQAMHNCSKYASGPFISIHCSSLPRDLLGIELFGYERGPLAGISEEIVPGKLELADGGTLFLNEIEDMPFETQKELFRAIKESAATRIGGSGQRVLNVRIITSINRNLNDIAAQHFFYRDLYATLSFMKIDIPPLRDRQSDIELIAAEFLRRLNSRYPERAKRFADGVMNAFLSYRWPGNIKELQRCVEYAFFSDDSEMIGISSLPDEIALAQLHEYADGVVSDASLSRTFEAVERRKIESALLQCCGDTGTAADSLGISRPSLYRKMRTLGIRAKTYRTAVRN
jgi:transcriptional regulator of acetoin/glycerol metabolism